MCFHINVCTNHLIFSNKVDSSHVKSVVISANGLHWNCTDVNISKKASKEQFKIVFRLLCNTVNARDKTLRLISGGFFGRLITEDSSREANIGTMDLVLFVRLQRWLKTYVNYECYICESSFYLFLSNLIVYYNTVVCYRIW